VFPRESDMAIAWREALANSIIHGNHENPGLSCMCLVLRIQAGCTSHFSPYQATDKALKLIIIKYFRT